MKKNIKTNKKKMRVNNKMRTGIDTNNRLIQAYGTILQNRLNFLPPWLEVPMRYSDIITFTFVGASTIDYVFRANSLNDPDRTSAGHQPRGYDQLTPAYNKYRVSSLDWYMECPSASMTYLAGVVMVNGVVTITSAAEVGEYPTGRFRTVGAGGAPSGIFTGNKQIHSFLGRSFQAYHTDDTTAATTINNPAEFVELHLTLTNPTASALIVYVPIEIKYNAIMFDPVVPGPS